MPTRPLLPRSLALFAVAGLGALGALALTGRSLRASPPAGPSPAAVAAPAPDERSVEVPLVVSFVGEPRTLPSGETELTFEVSVRTPLSFPVAMRVALPRGATIADGALERPVDAARAGVQRHTYRFRATEALSADNPFRVVVQGEAADRSMGLRADRAYPPAPAAAGRAARGGRPPSPLRR